MEFKEIVNKRHSVRNFSEKEIPVADLEDIVRTAERAPSWENSQPWNVYIATGDTLKRIREIWAGKYEAKVKGTPDILRSARGKEIFAEGFMQSRQCGSLIGGQPQRELAAIGGPTTLTCSLRQPRSANFR